MDDDARNLWLATTILEQAGHEVLGADGGAAAVDLACAVLPDLVLMDVQMRDVDGVTALRQLRARASTRSLKVVALTALAMRGDEERLIGEGFDGFIAKPIRYQAFLAEIARLLCGVSP